MPHIPTNYNAAIASITDSAGNCFQVLNLASTDWDEAATVAQAAAYATAPTTYQGSAQPDAQFAIQQLTTAIGGVTTALTAVGVPDPTNNPTLQQAQAMVLGVVQSVAGS